MGKELLADLNLEIFKIWLDTRPKMEMHDPNVCPTILGGVSRGFWNPVWRFGRSKCHFLALKIRHFWQTNEGVLGGPGGPKNVHCFLQKLYIADFSNWEQSKVWFCPQQQQRNIMWVKFWGGLLAIVLMIASGECALGPDDHITNIWPNFSPTRHRQAPTTATTLSVLHATKCR